MTYYIDSHCHLNHAKIGHMGSASAIIGRANAAGVKGMVTIGCRLDGEPVDLLGISLGHDNVWYTVGTHPHEASNPAEKAFTVDDIATLSAHPKAIGIGESGLDYFYNLATPEDQVASFRKHIRACLETGLPLVVHTRDADTDIMRILEEEAAGKDLRGVMHCFSSGALLARQAVDFGFYISFSGILTFKNAAELREIATTIPLERLLLETDSPYLAPEPERKKTNEPALIVHTARVLGELHGMSASEMGAQTAQNFFTLFPKAKETWVE